MSHSVHVLIGLNSHWNYLYNSLGNICSCMVPDAAPVQVIVWALEIHVSFLDIIVYILYYIWRQGDADGKGI